MVKNGLLLRRDDCRKKNMDSLQSQARNFLILGIKPLFLRILTKLMNVVKMLISQQKDCIQKQKILATEFLLQKLHQQELTL